MVNRPDGTSVQKPKGSILNDRDVRAVLFQILIVLGVLAAGWYLVSNTLHNLEQRKIATGFGFLGLEAGFSIGESYISYTAADTYSRAILVGIINTLFVSALGIVLATILGTIVGVARLSSNWLVAKLSSVYVEGLRNIPLLLQLFFWYTLIGESLPSVREAVQIIPGAVFLSQKGVKFPHIVSHPIHLWMGVLFAVGVIGSILWTRAARQHQERTGQIRPVLLPILGFVIVLPLLPWLAVGAPLEWDLPVLRGFNFQGGGNLSPELIALLVGLVLYTATFIAETVRAGILAVPKGQWEAAGALGLPRGRTLRLIILPQSLRVIIPPMTSQYLNLTKNSSLAVAIGYPDLVSILNTAINQTGQGIEGVALIMAAYLTVSLSISLFMNWYNKKIALVER
jgi:general L-amino acid transport system permease protein